MDINAGMDEKEAVNNIGGGIKEDFPRRNALASIHHKLSLISSEEDSYYGTLCIYKVPEKHRNQNPEAYAPQIVSVGFVHHGEPQLVAMEECKLRYLKNFLDRCSVSLEELVGHVDGEVNRVCGCYEEICVQKVLQRSKDPCEVILVDGIFIVELFLKNAFEELREKGDRVFENSMVSSEITHDLLLLENQLPFRFLSQLYDKVRPYVDAYMESHGEGNAPSFDKLAIHYFGNVGNTRKLRLDEKFLVARHFVEILSFLHVPLNCEKGPDSTELTKLSTWSLRAVFHKDFVQCPTAAELKTVGVKFKKEENCRLGISFDKRTGELTLPPLTVDRFTETLFRNLIAFEQSGHHLKWATSFVMFLDALIDTPKDVDVLIKHDVIDNELASSQQVADLFNTLYKEFPADTDEFYYVEECQELSDYSRHWWHRLRAEMGSWMVTMWRNYFSTPWSLCSLIAAITVLAFTAMQTAYAIKTYYRGH